jgi:serine/threonine protein kinase
MQIAIDRRLDRDVFWLFMQDPEFFGQTLNPPSESHEYREILTGLVPSDWEIRKHHIWLGASPADAESPLQGFKIHLSATSLTAVEVLRRVTPVCVENRAPFKVIADPTALEMMTSKNSSRGASGKFITIYPSDESHFTVLIKALDQATAGMAGPYILSDKRYRNNRVLFYRYGGFAPRERLNVFGEKVPVVSTSDGSLVPDERTPYFQLPKDIRDPFESDTQESPAQVRLNSRYLVQEALVHSNAGGVYKAIDENTGRTVIIKEARPLINVTRKSSLDAITMLQKEARVLERLGDTGYAPQLIDFFQEWEHFFLVEELVEGIPLSSYRARKDVALIFRRNYTEQNIKKFCSRICSITSSLIEALEAFHSRGIVMGDLSPNNILIQPDTLSLKVIDFETAQLLDEADSPDLLLFTPGFVSPSRRNGARLTPQDDLYSLGSVIYSLIIPVQQLFLLNSASTDVFIDEISRDFRVPSSIKELIFALFNGEASRARCLADSVSREQFELPPASPPRIHKQLEIRGTVERIADYILSTPETQRKDRLWPADYRLLTTNPLNVAYGAVGTALFLKAAAGEIPEHVYQWLDQQHFSTDTYPPGLFSGLAGIAWGFEELGLTRKAMTAMDQAYQSPLLHESPDVFFGAAGVGLSNLFFFDRTGEERFLERARTLGDSLIARASRDENGCSWKNVDGITYFGHCHGGSGIALFLLYLYEATGEPKYLSSARAGLEYEIAHGRISDDGAAWDRAKGDSLEVPYWRFGGAGVGSALIRFASMLGDARYRLLAEKAGNSALTKYAVFPGQFSGLSGIGEFLIDLYRFTGQQKYLDGAFKIAEGVLLFQIDRPEGIAFPGEELLRVSTDYGTGSAGIGMFLLRLVEPRSRLFFEFDARTVSAHPSGVRRYVDANPGVSPRSTPG